MLQPEQRLLARRLTRGGLALNLSRSLFRGRGGALHGEPGRLILALLTPLGGANLACLGDRAPLGLLGQQIWIVGWRAGLELGQQGGLGIGGGALAFVEFVVFENCSDPLIARTSELVSCRGGF